MRCFVKMGASFSSCAVTYPVGKGEAEISSQQAWGSAGAEHKERQEANQDPKTLTSKRRILNSAPIYLFSFYLKRRHRERELFPWLIHSLNDHNG